MEVKYRPENIGTKELDSLGDTVIFILCMYQILFGKRKTVVLDSEFCVEMLVVEL